MPGSRSTSGIPSAASTRGRSGPCIASAWTATGGAGASGSSRDRLRPSSESSPATPIAERLSLWATVDRLPERQRAVVYLRYRADLSFEEIGAALDIRPVSARSHVSRALDRLAVLMREEEETR